MEVIQEKPRRTTKDQKQSIGKHLMHIARALYTSLTNQKLKLKLKLFFSLFISDLNLLVKPLLHHSTKLIVPKSIDVSSLSCRSIDPATAFYSPQEIEFSCSNTPSYASLARKPRRGSRRQFLDSEAVARAFEILNSEASTVDDEENNTMMTTPSPMWGWRSTYDRNRNCNKSPMGPVRQLRVTDSPFPIEEERVGKDNQVDREAEEFIKRFYEQL